MFSTPFSFWIIVCVILYEVLENKWFLYDERHHLSKDLNTNKHVACSVLDAEKRSEFGQFMTPSAIARFMVSFFPDSKEDTCYLLDPGAGIGSLTMAFLERWKDKGFGFKYVHPCAFEIDEKLCKQLKHNLALFTRLYNVSSSINSGDFIELAVRLLTNDLFGQKFPIFTHAILNPPYKKINTQSRSRMLLRQAGIETVNLYSAFTALALYMLRPGGQLVAILPRSFCNGPYYRPFREIILSQSAVRRIHLFDARDKAFKDDAVLQENIIIHLERGGVQGRVLISTSTDDRFHDLSVNTYDFDRIVFPNDREKFIHVPTTPVNNTFDLYATFTHSLLDLDLDVSTGPIVDFRVRVHIRDMPDPKTVPLLYPCHFKSGVMDWPKPNEKKPNAILRNSATERWLYPNGFYTVVRRFSAKEERRRIMASVVDPSIFSSTKIAFENHLNVFHSNKKALPELLARGLSVYLNSTVVDNAFRRFNGHTQVNATDLRSMKYPSRQALINLGKWAAMQHYTTQTNIDRKVESIV